MSPDIQGKVDYRPLPPSPAEGRAQTHYNVSSSDSSPQGMSNRGARLVSQRSPAVMLRLVRRRTPSPAPSADEDSSVNPSVSPPPVAENQTQDGIVGLSARDIALWQAAANAAKEREARAQNKDRSRSQSDIDTDALEKAIDALTIEFGCEFCQHALQMGDADFNKLSADELLKDMRKRAPRLDLARFYGARAASKSIRAWLVVNDFQHHTTNIPNVLMVKYFAECQAKGRTRLNKNVGVEDSANNVLPVWGPRHHLERDEGGPRVRAVATSTARE